MNYPLVYIVVLNWNHLQDLILTLDSLYKQDYPNLKIIVSDNGSSDGSQTYIKNKYKKVILIENYSNLGWAAGNNVGITYALSNRADYVLLANNDIFLESRSIISTLVNDLINLKEAQINIIGTKVHYYDYKEKLHNEGWIMYPSSIKKGCVFNRYRENYNHKLPDNIKLVDFVSGCFILINSVVFNEIGLIDEAFYLYAEETEFSLRAWQRGFGSAINSELIIYHKIASTSKVGSPFSMYYRTRNLYYLLNKHKSNIPNIIYFKFKYYKDFIKTIVKIIVYPSNYHGARLKVLAATFNGFLDGVIFKRTGRNHILLS